jgi:hypothetical protein
MEPTSGRVYEGPSGDGPAARACRERRLAVLAVDARRARGGGGGARVVVHASRGAVAHQQRLTLVHISALREHSFKAAGL